MSISLDMYKILKKSSLRPIIFLDMDETFLVRYRDYSSLVKRVERMKKRIQRNMEMDDFEDSKEDSEEEFINDFESSGDRVLSAENLTFMVRGNFCDLIRELDQVGDIYVLTASKESAADQYLQELKNSENFRCAELIKGLISSIQKVSFNESDLGSLPEDPTMRPYVLIDDNHFGVSSPKHALMNRTGFKELEPFHVQVPRFYQSLDFDVQKIISEVKRKLSDQISI